jgi:hypothetical protein
MTSRRAHGQFRIDMALHELYKKYMSMKKIGGEKNMQRRRNATEAMKTQCYALR